MNSGIFFSILTLHTGTRVWCAAPWQVCGWTRWFKRSFPSEVTPSPPSSHHGALSALSGSGVSTAPVLCGLPGLCPAFAALSPRLREEPGDPEPLLPPPAPGHSLTPPPGRPLGRALPGVQVAPAGDTGEFCPCGSPCGSPEAVSSRPGARVEQLDGAGELGGVGWDARRGLCPCGPGGGSSSLS